jgi:hypothetical protein
VFLLINDRSYRDSSCLFGLMQLLIPAPIFRHFQHPNNAKRRCGAAHVGMEAADGCEVELQIVEAWQAQRNNKNSKINWQFTNKEARVKLKRLYPSIHN